MADVDVTIILLPFFIHTYCWYLGWRVGCQAKTKQEKTKLVKVSYHNYSLARCRFLSGIDFRAVPTFIKQTQLTILFQNELATLFFVSSLSESNKNIDPYT